MKRLAPTFILSLLLTYPSVCQIINIPADQATIQAGIDAAVDGDTILVVEGNYLENINFKGKAITVASQFLMDGDTSHISKTIIDGSQSVNPDTASTVLMISGEDVSSVLCGFTITGGSGTRTDSSLLGGLPGNEHYLGGGGIFIVDGGANIRNNIVSHNTVSRATQGALNSAGIGVTISKSNRSDGKTLLIQDNKIVSNTIDARSGGLPCAGGGLLIGIGSSLSEIGMDIIIQNNQISHNRILTSSNKGGGVGAGICLSFQKPIRAGNYIFRNNIVSHNGNSFSSLSPLYFEGAGVYVAYTRSGKNTHNAPLIYNNLISDNYSTDMGGGIGVYDYGSNTAGTSTCRPLIFNNTVVNNRSPISPGLDVTRSTPLLVNNIFWNPVPNSQTPEFRNINSHILSFNNLIRGLDTPGNGNTGEAPVFSENSFNLAKESPGIGAGLKEIEIMGVNYQIPNLDYYGNPRPDPVDAYVDLGAIESPYERIVAIPDTAFLYALIEAQVDENGDSLISNREAEQRTSLSLMIAKEKHQMDTVDLTGISSFIYLDTLTIYAYDITNLDLDLLKDLKALGIYGGNMETIDVSGNQLLEILTIHDGSGALLSNMQTLDVSNNLALKKLWCQNNQLSELDLSKNKQLKELVCSENRLEFLDLSNNPLLETLWCDSNELLSLDLSENPSLKELGAGKMPMLKEVCVFELPFPPPGGNIDTAGSPNVYFTNECVNQIVYVPDTAFLSALLEEGVDTNGDNLINTNEAKAIASLILSNDDVYGYSLPRNYTNIRDYTGIEAFENLKTLVCTYGEARVLNLSENQKLEYLNCRDNKLQTLEVSECENLKTLYCQENQLEGLDLTRNALLERLVCNRNLLSTLDLSQNTDLVQLNIAMNPIAYLNISHNIHITKLDIGFTPIREIDLTLNKELEDLNIERNSFRRLDVSNNVYLRFLRCYDNNLTELDLSNNLSLIRLDCRFNRITTLDLSKNTMLKYLDCAINQIYGLDLSLNTNLTELWCGNNLLDELDVSQLSKLKVLSCGDNQLGVLDVSKNTRLEDLECGRSLGYSFDENPEVFNIRSNNLTHMDVSNNSELKRLFVGGNQLSEIDLSSNIKLESLDCGANELSQLDLSKNQKISGLIMDHNRLESIHLEHLDSLHYFVCFDNPLATMDVSSNSELQTFSGGRNLFEHLNFSSNLKLDVLRITKMPDLQEVCIPAKAVISNNPFEAHENDTLYVDTTGSPNVYFTTTCSDFEPPLILDLDTLQVPDYIQAKSSEDGFIYLVPAQTPGDLQSIRNVVLDSVECRRDALVTISLAELGLEDGTYWLFASDLSGNFSEPKAFSISGVSSKDAEIDGIKVYPNPTRDYLFIESVDPIPCLIEIKTLNGQLIYNAFMNGSVHRIDLQLLQHGIYILCIRSTDQFFIKKIVKL